MQSCRNSILSLKYEVTGAKNESKGEMEENLFPKLWVLVSYQYVFLMNPSLAFIKSWELLLIAAGLPAITILKWFWIISCYDLLHLKT